MFRDLFLPMLPVAHAAPPVTLSGTVKTDGTKLNEVESATALR